MDEKYLDRFFLAQRDIYPRALAEIKAGKKKSHWMWFIFPRLRGLGISPLSYAYGIAGIKEARGYLAHPILSGRLLEATTALLSLKENDPKAIFGAIDAQKLCASMTLFATVSDSPEPFVSVIDRFFGGMRDIETLKLIANKN